MLRLSGSLLILGVACAAAVAPVVNETERLESLVRDMADSQQGTKSAPQPKAAELVVLEGSERRRLNGCKCSIYRDDAMSDVWGYCAKKEGKETVCYPAKYDGICDDLSETPCGGAKKQPAPSPGPRMLLDSELVDVEGGNDMFLEGGNSDRR